jgi:uncharacterized protein YggL (DUF469 family)
MPNINIPVSEEMHQSFKRACVDEQKKMGEQATTLIQKWLDQRKKKSNGKTA